MNLSKEIVSRKTVTKFERQTLSTHQKAVEDPGGATAPDDVGILCEGGSTVSTISFFSPIAATHAHMRFSDGLENSTEFELRYVCS